MRIWILYLRMRVINSGALSRNVAREIPPRPYPQVPLRIRRNTVLQTRFDWHFFV